MTTVQPACANCHASIPPADVNIGNGTMLCRACGQISHLPSLSSHEDVVTRAMVTWSPEVRPTPKPRRSRTLLALEGDLLELRRRTGSRGTGIFLLFWLTGWTAGTIALIVNVVNEPSLFSILFAVPFVAAWFFVVAWLMDQFFGHEILRIDPRGLRHERSTIVRVRSVECSIDDVRSIVGFSEVTDSESGHREHGLEICTAGDNIRYGQGLSDDDRLWLADVIRRHIHALAPQHLPITPFARSASAATGWSATTVEILSRSDPAHERPAQSNIHLRREFNRTEFTRKGSLREVIGTVAVLTFVNLFWNGIVGVFVLQLVSNFSWLVFLFLIPFEAIGLCIVGLWLAVITTPAWRQTWTFTPGEIRRRFTVFGLGLTRQVEMTRLARLETRPSEPSTPTTRPSKNILRRNNRLRLAIVSADDKDLLEITGLSENEARWIADELFADFRQWFISVGA